MTNGADYPGPDPWPLAGCLTLTIIALLITAVLLLT